MSTFLTPDELARRIEHTLLAPEATPVQIDRLCDEAIRHGFIGVCVNPIHVRRAAARLAMHRPDSGDGSGPFVVSVAGFPLGASMTVTKADEARRAMDDGAVEIDMVAPLGALVAGDGAAVRRDIEALAAVVHRAHPAGRLKVILETAALTREQILLGCRCCAEGEADYVKTSTGLHRAGGATVEQVALLHRHIAPIGVKAAGGIRSGATALAMIEAGAERIGTSSGVMILAEFRGKIS